MMKRGYFLFKAGEDCGGAVVATSVKEAKRFAWANKEEWCDPYCEYTDVRVRWVRDSKVDNLPIGYVSDLMAALKAGIYGYVIEAECPECKDQDTVVYNENGFMGCSNCVKKGEL